jgi:hypothetical protein
MESWEQAFPELMRRREELARPEAQAAFKQVEAAFTPFPATHRAIFEYVRLFNLVLKGNGVKIQKYFEEHPPKLTYDDLLGLTKIRDIASARVFMNARRSVWLELLIQRWVSRKPFWHLLLASAELVGADDATAGTFRKTTVVISESSLVKRVCKFLPLGDGGFSVTTPYHSARSGLLMKMRRPSAREVGEVVIKSKDTVPFNASDRVKLSYHMGGFVQFSGESSSRILSGWDAERQEPKGLGIMTNPLLSPVESGPSVGCVVWGLQKFENWSARLSEDAIVFAKDEEFYTEPDGSSVENSPPKSTIGYHFSAFIFDPADVIQAVGQTKTGAILKILLPMNIYNRDTPFHMKLIHITERCTLGIIANRVMLGYGGDGFSLNGPSDEHYNIMAMYPAPAGSDPGRNIDYSPISGDL